jgi:hypothetical protein
MKKLIFLLPAFLFLSSFTPEAGYKVGDKVTDFKLMNVNDKIVSLADFNDAKGLSWCSPATIAHLA